MTLPAGSEDPLVVLVVPVVAVVLVPVVLVVVVGEVRRTSLPTRS